MEITTDSASQLPPDDVAAIDELGKTFQAFRAELAKAIIGQDDVIEKLAICLFARGHALLMGVPGLAKTLLVSSVAQTFDLSFNRIAAPAALLALRPCVRLQVVSLNDNADVC